MDLTKMRIFELENNSDNDVVTESSEIDTTLKQEQDVVNISTHDGLSNDAESGTPNTVIDTPAEINICPTTFRKFEGDIEKLEDKIEMDNITVRDAIVENYYNLNRELMLAQVQLEAISINTIKKQCKILSESALGTQKYQDDINVLIESSGSNIFMTIINAIKSFIAKAKMFITKLISVHLVDYEKWASANRDKLLEKAEKYGSQITVNMFDWNEDLLMTPINFKKLHSCYHDFIKDTDNKESMEAAADQLMNKYENVNELSNAVYCYVLALSIGGNPKGAKLTEKETAIRAFNIKFKGTEKTITMDKNRTEKFINKLAKMSKKTASVMSAIERESIDDDFKTLLREVEKESNKREEKPDTIKYKYYKNKFIILSAIQSACNDICKMQISLINSYSKELYVALKALNANADDTDVTNEAIMNIEENIKGITLHE